MTPVEMALAREILAKVKPLAIEYYVLTGKPLGVTGEIGEVAAAELFSMTLMPARSVGFDAMRGQERVQIKARAKDPKAKQMGRLSRISLDKPCDTVMLTILDASSMDLIEVWEAPFDLVKLELARPGAKSRTRGQLAVSKFKSLGRRTWASGDPTPAPFVAAIAVESESAPPLVKASSTAGTTANGVEIGVERGVGCPNWGTRTP